MNDPPHASLRATQTGPIAALLSFGFRPFFLGAGLVGALAIPYWLLILAGRASLPSHLAPSLWHGHEMLFGYGGAVLAGFLLTATPGWSGREPVQGLPLAPLALLWLAGRVAIWAGAAVPAVAVVLDLAFLPALVIAIAPALENAQRRTLVFLPLLGGLFLANLWVHLDALEVLPGTGFLALRLALDLFVLLIALIGGRVIPVFTGNALHPQGGGPEVRPFGLLDRLALGALVALILVDLAAPPIISGAVALLCAALHGARLYGWQSLRTLNQPILWVLHLGYGWLCAGLAWKGVVEVTGFAPPSDALHGLAVGAVGTMTLGVMSRAALGHTGRPLVVAPAIVASYLLVSVAALARLAATLLSDQLLPCLMLSGLSWSLAFVLFLIVYTPMLFGPRADRPPG